MVHGRVARACDCPSETEVASKCALGSARCCFAERVMMLGVAGWKRQPKPVIVAGTNAGQ